MESSPHLSQSSILRNGMEDEIDPRRIHHPNPLPENPSFLCYSCRKLPYHPKQCLDCGAIVCLSCIYCQDSNCCVNCQTSLNYSDLTHNLKAILTSYRIRCRNYQFGCPQVIGFGELQEHEKVCTYKPIACDFCSKEIMETERDIHMQECELNKHNVTFEEFYQLDLKWKRYFAKEIYNTKNEIRTISAKYQLLVKNLEKGFHTNNLYYTNKLKEFKKRNHKHKLDIFQNQKYLLDKITKLEKSLPNQFHNPNQKLSNIIPNMLVQYDEDPFSPSTKSFSPSKSPPIKASHYASAQENLLSFKNKREEIDDSQDDDLQLPVSYEEKVEKLVAENLCLKNELEIMTSKHADLFSAFETLRNETNFKFFTLGSQINIPSLLVYIQGFSSSLVIYDTATKQSFSAKLNELSPFPHHYSAMIKIQSQIFICGGQDKNANNTNATYEIIIGVEAKAIRKKDMNNKISVHSLTQNLNKFIYSVGGWNKQEKDICEKYHMNEDKWTLIPNLNETKSLTTLINYSQTRIYCFGGCGSKQHDIEVLDLNNEESGWKIIEIFDKGGWGWKYQSNGIQISKSKILLFGGHPRSNETYIFNIKDNSLSKHSHLAQKASFVNNYVPPLIYGGQVFSVSHDLTIHIYNISQMNWRCIVKADWIC